jgi:tetratricopeptide (TPR) repeat protein
MLSAAGLPKTLTIDIGAVGLSRPKPTQANPADDDGEKTIIAPRQFDDDDKTCIAPGEPRAEVSDEPAFDFSERDISREKTVIFQRKEPLSYSAETKSPRRKLFEKIKLGAIVIAIGLVANELMSFDVGSSGGKALQPIRPKLPAVTQGSSDPQASEKIYLEGLRIYFGDTIEAYRVASDKFWRAASLDSNNVKALGMLASSYLNLIDVSNKDESYFIVISKLIEMSRAKATDLPETVMADTEFFIAINKPEAAQNRIVEYTKSHQNFGLEMFFYLAYAFYQRGDFAGAARYARQIPDNKIYSARYFYLRGQIAEKLGDVDSAIAEYRKGLGINKQHARSHLRIAHLFWQSGKVKNAVENLKFLRANPGLLAPKERALGYFLNSRFNQLQAKLDLALGDIEKAVKLDKDNHDYVLDYYELRMRAGDSVQALQKNARMFFFLGEGEKLLKEGKYQEALSIFLQARQVNDASPLPLVRAGDMFTRLHDVGNAKMNYQLAAQRAPNNIDVWAKYIDVLIQSYEWEEAQKAMDKFRKLPVSQSSLDKAAGDMYAKMGRHKEANVYYRKAMGRETVDANVYIAFAKNLMNMGAYQQAPFFYALALRFDPMNIDAIIGVAKCVAETESIERGINTLQDELQKTSAHKAALLAGIAELNIQRGEWSIAQQFVDQAFAADREYAYPWLLQARIHKNKEGLEKDALDKALAAFKSYSDRNISDPSGYLERYQIFLKKTEFEKASDELSRVYALYPKYPSLHYYKGALYGVMANHKAAIDEYNVELKNNPQNVIAMIALGKELVELGAVQEALTHFNKSMQLQPTSAEAKQQSGYANYLLKNYQGAVALYRAALAIDTANPIIYKRLGMAYRDMGDPAGASQAFRKYLEMEPDAPDKAEFQQFL